MDHEQMIETLWNNNVRVERVIWVPGAMGSGSVTEDLQDFLEEITPYDKYQPKILKTLPQLQNLLDEIGDEPIRYCEDLIIEYLQNVDGFFVQLASPVKTRLASGHLTYSWAVYQTDWFYVRSMEELVYVSSAFAESVKIIDETVDKFEDDE